MATLVEESLMITQPKILVLTASPIDGPGIGSLFLRDMEQSVPDLHFEFVVIPPHWLGPDSSRYEKLVRILRGIAGRSKYFQSIRLTVFRRFYLAMLSSRISKLARDKNADKIIVTATSPEIVALAAQLSELGNDTRIMVWDTPEYLASNLPLSQRQTSIHLRAFDQMMRSAQSIAVISNALSEKYKKKYNIPCKIIRHGVNLAKPIEQARPSHEVRIVFAGSLYCKTEWNSFVSALISNNWYINGKRIRLFFIGNFPLTGATRPAEMTFLGHLPFDQTLETLATMHIGYLPYWFSKSYELVARTSFPGKMSAYAAAGLTVFHHAPAYTEGSSFLKDFPFGIVCSSLKPKNVIESLETLINIMMSKKTNDARNAAWHQELSSTIMSQRVQDFIS
jgi:hypothetical protein